MVTYNDIARAAGVSPAKVSRALNSNRNILPEEADRIRAIARGLGYKGNRAAHCIATGRSRIIGCLMNDLTNPYVCDLVAGIERTATANDHAVLLSDGSLNECRNLNRLVQYRIDGLILGFMPTDPEAEAELEDFMGSGGVVAAAFEFQHPSVSTLCVDHRSAAASLVGYLGAKGHHRIAFAGGRYRESSRYLGYADGMHRNGFSIPAGYAMEGPGNADTFEGGLVAAGRIAVLVPRPTAVIAYNDYMALGMISRFMELGLRVPEDISVCGFDGIQTIRVSGPRLVTVAADNRTWGEELASMLFGALETPGIVKRHYPWTVIDGDTVRGIV